jgi:diguanylate cyclase (GGDEF)-like protein
MIMLNFIVTVVLSLLNISDVALMLTFSHINIGLAVIMTSILMWKAIKNKTIDVGFLHTVITGMSFAMFGAGVDLLRYLLVPRRIVGNSIFTRVGVLVFVIFMMIHLLRERTRIAVERERSLLMEKLAYTDGLTGLKNRLAFHLKENEIRTEHISCNVVQLDINNLKKVNDEYGHAEGDRHIISAANIISSCFAEIGSCYRTGGDEFIVIAQNGDSNDVDNAIKEMENRSRGYNEQEKPPVPMQIAYGHAHYSAQTDLLETAEKLADQRMYEKKKQMKKVQTNML